MLKKLAIISSHPIQYNAPLFKLLAERNIIDLKVFYTWGNTVLENKYDPGFKKDIIWDIPLLDGYVYEFLTNTSSNKGSHHFRGIINPDIIQKIDEYNPDAILVYGWSFNSHLKVLRHYRNKRIILFRGDSTTIDNISFLKGLIRTFFLKYIYLHVNYALYVGKTNLHYYKKMGLKQKQLVYAPHAIDNKRFLENKNLFQKKAVELKEKLAIATDKIIFLFAGKLEGKKNPSLLLRSFLSANIEDSANLIIVGNGILEKQLKIDFAHFKSIHFVDFQNQIQMPIIYHLADVFVLPSKGPGETWGLSVNEAMACSLPIIISDKCGSAEDLVKNGENGYIFNSLNEVELVTILQNCVSIGKQGLNKMGKISNTIIENFSYDKFCVATENLLNPLKTN